MQRISITTEAEVITKAKEHFINGIICGNPIAENVTTILVMSVSFGADEAERKNFERRDGLRVADTYDDLKKIVVADTLATMFTSGFNPTVEAIVQIGISFGYRNCTDEHERKIDEARMKEKRAYIAETYPKIEEYLNRAKAEFATHLCVSEGTSDLLFTEIVNLPDEIKIMYLKEIATAIPDVGGHSSFRGSATRIMKDDAKKTMRSLLT
jgi:hypothetical protein